MRVRQHCLYLGQRQTGMAPKHLDRTLLSSHGFFADGSTMTVYGILLHVGMIPMSIPWSFQSVGGPSYWLTLEAMLSHDPMGQVSSFFVTGCSFFFLSSLVGILPAQCIGLIFGGRAL